MDQVYNTPLLSAFLDQANGQTLIDHELLTAPNKTGTGLKRVAAFGWYAGAAGAGEALCLTGLALLRRGTATPLLVCPTTVTYAEPDLRTYQDRILSPRSRDIKPAWARLA
jgi:alpha-aminoadipic semialdehyde synthase